jgi:lysozyme family protein
MLARYTTKTGKASEPKKQKHDLEKHHQKSEEHGHWGNRAAFPFSHAHQTYYGGTDDYDLGRFGGPYSPFQKRQRSEFEHYWQLIMAQFGPAYFTYVKPIEGGYANVEADKGGETYAGIARRFWPNWAGWKTIDAIKAASKTNPPIRHNARFPQLDASVEQFYRDMWNANRFGEINDQDVANIAFDWFVNSGASGIRGVQKILGVSQTGVLGLVTLTAINQRDSVQLFNSIKAARKSFYDAIVQRDPSQQVFYKGWINRIEAFVLDEKKKSLGAGSSSQPA